MKTLTIISHTEHYKDSDGNIVGLGSTVTEINNLLKIFDKIIHVAMLHDTIPPPSSLPYVSDRITFVALPAVGGKHLKDKLRILSNMLNIIKIVSQQIEKGDIFQFRAPTGIGVFIIPYLMCCTSKKGWFKYAGNWKQKNAPKAYAFQRWLLKKQNRSVTINGIWSNQPGNCITFENPCITDEEFSLGKALIENKTKGEFLEFCFVGRLEKEKGLDLLILAFKSLTDANKKRIKKVHIVGDGIFKQDYISKSKDIGVNFEFHGFLSRQDVQQIYTRSHSIILPSVSEGFPKVIAEAMNFGCIPIVSDISSIDNYIINQKNGFLIHEITKDEVVNSLIKIFDLSQLDFSLMINYKREDLGKFTYNYYNQRIKELVLMN